MAGVRPPLRLPKRKKPRLGIAVRPALAHALIEALKDCRPLLDRFEVWAYPFTRLHFHLETVLRLKKAFGSRFHYVEQYLGPVDSFRFVGHLDLSLNDTYHGTIAAVVARKPFIALRFHDAPRSRTLQLLALLGIRDRSIRVHSEGLPPAAYDSDVRALRRALPCLLERPQTVPDSGLARVRELVGEHFDRLAAAIDQTSGTGSHT